MRCMKRNDLWDLWASVHLMKTGMHSHWKRSCFVCTVMYHGNLQSCSLIYCDKQLFPQCWYKSSADLAVSGPLLYWLSHWSSLWSTKGMKKRKETRPAHTRACNLYHYFLTCAHLCPQTHKLHKHVEAETHCCIRGRMQPEATTQSFTVLQPWYLYYTNNCTRATDAVPCGD